MESKNNVNWDELSWETKVQLCELSRANENSQLQSYRLIFIAIESILFAVVFGVAWNYVVIVFCLDVLGIFLTIVWWHVARIRGEASDRWEKLLYELWGRTRLTGLETWEKKIISQFTRRYQGAAMRWGKKEHIQLKNSRLRFKPWEIILSARWWLNNVLPLLTGIAWITVIVLRARG
jgi:hypothetical protein